MGTENILTAVLHADELNTALTEEFGKEIYHYHLHVIAIPVVQKEIKYSKRCKDKSLVGKTKEVINQVSHSKKWKSEQAVDGNSTPLYDEKGKPILIKYPEYDDTTLREFEILSYGMYITNHPCSKYKDVIKVENIKNYLFKNINMVLLIKSIRTIKDKKGGEMAFLECEDETGKVNLTMFSSLYAKNNDLKANELIIVNVKVSKRFDKLNVLVNNIKRK